ncbi:protein of unknown function [Taphrina deformans PYCC 5710]|uniref:HNH nuclease domain-containing protein n=1 Tax=Taphrina deformans (strain PYCC 5710 / ATCC 11124 / CBS 356.35 / IMI 108563 / JCM 9778 / NBRC 8474) TaxID=1097556 RepID=R4X9A6_TAPDE|nr:protein of unknown function [Taphrina deformans PYCC 5710]|eukprot:CCG82270.1 protein of unknown function [Taphrina deformans PYCC 5710]
MLRDSVAEPRIDAQYITRRKLTFKHPAYSSSIGGNTILSLWAWDSSDGGIHHGTALLACMLVACNAFDGYLSLDQNGVDPVTQGYDEPLPFRRDNYYFHVPNIDEYATPRQQSAPAPALAPASAVVPHKYPVYATFDHWRFPHNLEDAVASSSSEFCIWLSKLWFPSAAAASEAEDVDTTIIWPEAAMATPVSSAVTAAILARDRLCLMSRYGDGLDRAHICPRNEHGWFHKNMMQRYNDREDLSGDAITDDVANSLLMRTDIHRAFDQARFCIVPKEGRWVAHFLEKTVHLASQYHNRPLPVPSNVAPQFFLARLAWAIFPRIKNFFETGVPRLVRVQEKQPETGEYTETDRMMGKHDMAALLSTGRGRSSSPRKRVAPQDGNDTCFTRAIAVAVDSVQGHAISPSPPVYPLSSSTIRPPKKRRRADTEQDNSDQDERCRHFRMRAAAVRSRRPTHLDLMCCDYDAAERANALGEYGKAEFGGGHLCIECLGLEIRHEEEEEEEGEDSDCLHYRTEAVNI